MPWSRKGSAMDSMRRPLIHELDRAGCREVLARNHVGRLAFLARERVEILPLHYVYADDWIFGRTTPGMKLDMLGQNRWVAFEVDEVDGIFDWRSVVVHGGFYPLPADGSPRQREIRLRAIDLLGRLVPGTLTEDDPVASRTAVFGIAVQEATGRAATTRYAGTVSGGAAPPASGG